MARGRCTFLDWLDTCAALEDLDLAWHINRQENRANFAFGSASI
jgi:hypothetical protein